MGFQFGDPAYCIGIECKALNKAGSYDCVIGKEEKEVSVSLADVDRLIQKYGKENVIRKVSRKDCYIIPVKEVER